MTFACFRLGTSLLCIVALCGRAANVEGQSPEREPAFDPSLQLAENPPMKLITRQAPPLPEFSAYFDVRDGFKVVDNLDDLRAAFKKDDQKIRLKPAHYTAKRIEPPFSFTKKRPVAKSKEERTARHEQIFLVSGSRNVSRCLIRSVGPVNDAGSNNRVIRLKKGTTAKTDRSN